jgi:uncharacterized protein (DUF2062 family)
LTEKKHKPFKKVKKKVISFLLYGITPPKLSLAITLGLLIGLSPLYGLTTVLCLLIALIFRLNHAAIQFFNYIVWPLQIVLIYPFILLSESIFVSDHILFSKEEILYLLKTNWLKALEELGAVYLFAGITWLIFAIPLSIIFYFVFKNILKRINIEKYKDYRI